MSDWRKMPCGCKVRKFRGKAELRRCPRHAEKSTSGETLVSMFTAQGDFDPPPSPHGGPTYEGHGGDSGGGGASGSYDSGGSDSGGGDSGGGGGDGGGGGE